MRQVALIVGMLGLVGGNWAAGPEVDQDEILRLGNVVQRVGHAQDAEVDAFMQAMSPPADDNDKWFISVVTMQGCPACNKLKKDWASDQWLRSLAKPDDPKTSWAHINFYDKDDKSQQWRFEKIKISAYPTIVVQPPRSNKYGNPSTVVYQGVYGGDPQALAQAITGAIRRYVATLPQVKQVEQKDQRPPWQPAPKVDPPIIPDARPLFPNLPNEPVNIPPELRPSIMPRAMFGDMLMLLAGAALPLAIGGLIFGLKFIRAKRVEAGKPLLLDDNSMDQVLKVLQLMQALAEAKAKLPTQSEEAPAKKAG